MPKRNRKAMKLSPGNRAVLLRMLREIEKQEPKEVYYLNIFNTGFIVDTKQAKQVILKLLKGVISKKS